MFVYYQVKYISCKTNIFDEAYEKNLLRTAMPAECHVWVDPYLLFMTRDKYYNVMHCSLP